MSPMVVEKEAEEKRANLLEKVIKLTDDDIDTRIKNFLEERGVTTIYSKFTHSLNAMREAENLGITLYRWTEKYDDCLCDFVELLPNTGPKYIWNLDARTKAEAFILASDLI